MSATAIALWTALAILAPIAADQDTEDAPYSIRRDILQSDGKTIRLYSDLVSLLTIVYNERDQIIDCMYLDKKVASTAVSWLLYEALVGRTAGNNTAYFADVKRIYRKCKRRLREVSDNTTMQEHVEVMARKRIKEGFEAAPLCNLHDHETPGTASTGLLKPEDSCCKSLHNCSLQIPGFKRNYNLFNYYSSTAFSCNCTMTFRNCLNEIGTPLAMEIDRVYFNPAVAKCFIMNERRDKCVKYDDWYAQCIELSTENYASFASLSEAIGSVGVIASSDAATIHDHISGKVSEKTSKSEL